MSITAFWSLNHGANTTANATACALCMACGHDSTTFLMQTHHSRNNLDEPLIGEIDCDPEVFFKGIGIDTLTEYYKANLFSAERMKNALVPIGENDKLFLLTSTRKVSKELFDNEDEQPVILSIIREAARSYDEVVVDVDAGLTRLSRQVLEIADNVVICLKQNGKMVESVLQLEMVREFLKQGKAYFLFGNYDDGSVYNLRNLRRKFKLLKEGNSGVIPHHVEYMDAISDCNVYRMVSNTVDSFNPKEPDYDSWWYEVDDFVSKLH